MNIIIVCWSPTTVKLGVLNQNNPQVAIYRINVSGIFASGHFGKNGNGKVCSIFAIKTALNGD